MSFTSLKSLQTELSATYDAMRSAAGTSRYHSLKSYARQIREQITRMEPSNTDTDSTDLDALQAEVDAS